jgi:hypothetical protein
MTKYYTRKECFDLCNDNDIPFVYGRFNSADKLPKKELLKKSASIHMSLDCIDSDKWQIKRAEPKVFNFKHWVENYAKNESIINMEAFKASEENGQLREWLRPEQVELREALNQFTPEEMEKHHGSIDYQRIVKALKNLKPPYQQQKQDTGKSKKFPNLN